MKEDLNLNKKMGALVYDAAIDRMDIRYGLNRFHGGLHCGEQFEVLVASSPVLGALGRGPLKFPCRHIVSRLFGILLRESSL